MAWERPISHEDELNSWEDEEFAYDDDTATWAKTIPLPAEIWTGWLVFTWPQFIAAWFDIYLVPPGVHSDIEIEGWNGLTWRRWCYFYNTKSPRHVHMWFVGEAWSKMRLRFRHHGAGWLRLQIDDVRIDRICGGPLVAICSFLSQAGDFFHELASDIQGVFIIGEYLAAPFAALAELLDEASVCCCQASAALQGILDALQEGISLENFAALLEEHFPLLYYLVVDTPGQVRYLIAQAFDLTPYEAQSAEFIIKALFERWFPSLYLLWRDPQMTLAGWLAEHFPLLYYLIVDPKGQMLYLLAQLFDLTPYQAQNAEFIVKSLLEKYFPGLYRLWRWLDQMFGVFDRDGWRGVVTELQTQFYGVAERALRFLWEGEW